MNAELHRELGAQFLELNGAQVVAHYGDVTAELAALQTAVGVLDLSFRSRLCLIGADRAQFLHGQVTNDIKKLTPGQGCYAVLTTLKGKLQSDLNILNLTDELLLDFEPGLSAAVTARLEKYIVSEDVQIVDAAPHYGLLSAQGPKAADAVRALGLFGELPSVPLASVKVSNPTLGDIYLAAHARLNSVGYDLYIPTAAVGAVLDKLIAAAQQIGGRAAGWEAFEVARVETGVPRFGADMDENCLPQECGIEARAMSYNKGCYIGQEVLNRIHSFGHVNRGLYRLRLADGATLPARGTKLSSAGKEVGHITSAVYSPTQRANIALAILRREATTPEAGLSLPDGTTATVLAAVG